MTDTVNLGLPCIEGSQAQKHVTHNDALRILDTLVQLVVLDRDLTAPPASPSEGQRWIVKATGTGAWAGHNNAIAAWQDGAWQFSTPQPGWIAFVADEGTLIVWSGTAWGDFFSTVTSIQNLAMLGIGTTADSTNRLSAKLNNALFTARTVAEGGDGHLRYKLSKESTAKTLSFLFQDNFSGRAEIGLAGDDDFHLKVSPDGSTWYEGIVIDRTTGAVTFPHTTIAGGRESLAANRTYYVRTDGSDGNNGLANTSAGAFLTLQKAVDTVAALDLSTWQATIQVGDGTYTGAVTLKRYLGSTPPIIQGNATTPANVVISTTSANCFTNDNGSLWIVKDLKVQTTTGGHCLYATSFGAIYFSNLVFGACAAFHLYSQSNATIKATGNYAVSGGAQIHAAANGWIISSSKTITYSNAPNFSVCNFLAGRGGVIECFGMTFTNGGTVTGPRYLAADNGAIFTGTGGSATFIPGSTAGSASSGGQYN